MNDEIRPNHGGRLLPVDEASYRNFELLTFDAFKHSATQTVRGHHYYY
jgi:hypothetical protein